MKRQYTCTECGKVKYGISSIGGHLQSHVKGLKKAYWGLYIKEAVHLAKFAKKKKSKVKAVAPEKKKTISYKHILSPKFYTSREWRTLRYKVITQHGNICMACGASPQIDGIVIHVDHIKPRSLYPELALMFDNMQILCADCNLGKSNIDETDWRIDDKLKDQIQELNDGFRAIVGR